MGKAASSFVSVHLQIEIYGLGSKLCEITTVECVRDCKMDVFHSGIEGDIP